ncbi:MAG: AAA family ATPase [Magnetococcales bacterium]|nr:AAA family ATPase [Magnetococcales bacterium]
MVMRLTRLTLNRFKNIALEDGFAPGELAVLIGPNGCGKSNLVNVLRFLKKAMTGVQEEDVGGTVWANALDDILGGPGILDATLTPPQTVQMAFDFEGENWPDGIRFEWELGVRRDPSWVFIQREWLRPVRNFSETDGPFYYRFDGGESGPGSLIVPGYNWLGSQSTQQEIKLRDLLCFKAANQETALAHKGQSLVDSIAQWRFYSANDMKLKEIRSAEPKVGLPATVLSDSGENLLTVFDNLCQLDIEFEERINEACREILPETRTIRPARVGRLNLGVEWYVRGIKDPFYLRDMSDGTVRMLCWAVILKSPKPATLLVLDEPELGLHVVWMPILAKWIKRAAARGTQVIVATHSSDLLDHFGDQIDHVHCFQYGENGRFAVRPLSPERLAARLEEGWQLGDLYRVGDPDVGGWPW